MATASLNGIVLSYDDRGEGAAVLMICGTGMQAVMWDQFGTRPRLDEVGYRTITFDNRGMPPSTVAEPPYRVEQMADDAIALLEHLGLEECFVLGGSLGANIAQTVALRRPNVVRAAVLVVGGGNFSRAGQMSVELSATALRSGGEVAALVWREGLLDATLTPAQRRDGEAIEFVLTVLGDSFLDVQDWTGLLGQMEANLEWANEDHLSELKDMAVPCLLIGHEFDPVFSVEGRQQAAATMPDSELLIVPSVSHVPLDPEASEVSGKAIVEFLASH